MTVRSVSPCCPECPAACPPPPCISPALFPAGGQLWGWLSSDSSHPREAMWEQCAGLGGRLARGESRR